MLERLTSTNFELYSVLIGALGAMPKGRISPHVQPHPPQRQGQHTFYLFAEFRLKLSNRSRQWTTVRVKYIIMDTRSFRVLP